MSRGGSGIRISLLGGFQLESEGPALILPEGSQRLLALLALKGRLIKRQTVAGTLWPVATEAHASSSLRSALARLGGRARATVEATARDLGLSDDVAVDLWDARALADRLLGATGSSTSAEPGEKRSRPSPRSSCRTGTTSGRSSRPRTGGSSDFTL